MTNQKKIRGGFGQPIADIPQNATTGGSTKAFVNTDGNSKIEKLVKKHSKKKSRK